jgi:dTDP-glucose 4,6-dehydratase/UDP-glucose 4-epimerase
MKLLILGSEGFIGGYCTRYFAEKGYFVFGADIFEQPSQQYRYYKVSRLSTELDEIFLSENFDAVINAAGSAHVNYSMNHPLLDFEANSFDTIRTLDAIRKYQPACKYLHISSAAVYGNPVALPIKEDDALHPLSPYGWHKLIAENLCREYVEVFGLSICMVRPFSVYGPGLKKQMFWEWYQKAKAISNKIELLGTGNETRDYINIKDLVRALEALLQNSKFEGEVYNLASGTEITINKIASLFFPALNNSIKYSFNGVVRAGDPLNWCADVSKLKKLGFSTKYTIETGVNELIDWLTHSG